MNLRTFAVTKFKLINDMEPDIVRQWKIVWQGKPRMSWESLAFSHCCWSLWSRGQPKAPSRHRLKIIEYVPSRKATHHPHGTKTGAQNSCKAEHYHLLCAQKMPIHTNIHKHTLTDWHMHTLAQWRANCLTTCGLSGITWIWDRNIMTPRMQDQTKQNTKWVVRGLFVRTDIRDSCEILGITLLCIIQTQKVFGLCIPHFMCALYLSECFVGSLLDN